MFGNHAAGIYEKAFDPQTTWQEKLDKAARLGFDYVEISIDETDERLARLDWTREEKKALLDLSLEELKAFHPAFEPDAFEAIAIETCIALRDIPGGPAPSQVAASIVAGEELLKKYE